MSMLDNIVWCFWIIIFHHDYLSDVSCFVIHLAEDDTSIATEVKVPILMAFHRHIYDREWHFACEFSCSDLKLRGILINFSLIYSGELQHIL